jgi:hypothetical protein
MYAKNELIPMTRRYPKLSQKVLYRDSKISEKLIKAWDLEHDTEKVLSIYLKELKNLSDERYWELMRTVWIISGSVENSDTFRKLMQSNKRERYYFSTPEESEKLRNFPEMICIYRATNDENDNGLSWTISREYAQWYKEAYNKSIIISRAINKKDIFALIERNSESEIIVL